MTQKTSPPTGLAEGHGAPARGVRLALAAVAALIGWWSLSSPEFRRVNGELAPDVMLPCAVVTALLVLACSEGRWRVAGRWFALLLAGQGAALALIDAPNDIAYQHYRLEAGSLATGLALLVLTVQLACVAVGLRSRLAGLRAWAGPTLTIPAAAAIGLVFVLTSAAPSRDLVQFAGELAIAASVQLVSLANVVCLAAAVPQSGLDLLRIIDRLRGDAASGPAPPAIDRFALLLAAWVTLSSALLVVFVYQLHPHVPDEVVYLKHAEYLARGMLAMPVPPVPEAFNFAFMDYDSTRWFSALPPGWPAMLAVGELVGLPWLVNPILGGLCVLLASAVLAELYPPRTRRLALLLLALSPWFIYLSMSFMTHQASLACALAAALFVARARRRDSGKLALMAASGAFIGLVSLIRPLEGLAVALLLGIWSLGIRAFGFRFAPSLALVAGTLSTALLVRPYNAFLTGSPSRFPLMVEAEKMHGVGSNDLGFGPDRGFDWGGLDPIPGHGAIDVVVNSSLNLFAVNVELLGWATGSLVLLLLLAGSRRLLRSDWLMAAVVIGIMGIHSFYWFAGGPDFGARYWYLVIVPAVALTARGAEVLGETLAPLVRSARERTTGAVLACVLASLLVFIPWRAIGKYYHYREMHPGIQTLAAQRGFGRSLVLVRGERFPDYVSAATYNPLDLRADQPIYAFDASPEVREAVLRHYRDRRIWLVDGPSLTGIEYRVRAGPLLADEALDANPHTRRNP